MAAERPPITNWRRGLNRLFVLTCAAWAFFVLVVFPFREVARARDFAAQSEALSAAYGATPPSVERKNLQAQLWEQATLSHFYRREMFAHWPLVLAALVVPPALVYGFVRGIVAIAAWVFGGFRG